MSALMSNDFAAALLALAAVLLVGWLWVRDTVVTLWVLDGSGHWHRAREATLRHADGRTLRTAWTQCGWCLPVQRVVAGDAPLSTLLGEASPRVCARCE